MALKLNRLTKFYGGITVGDKDNKDGVCLNIEEFDIFSNPNLIEPETIFAADAVITRQISGYTKDDADNLYALGRTTDPYVQIWKKASASTTSPGAWASLYSSGSVTPTSVSPIAWHKWNDATSWLYYITGADNATTRTIYRTKTDGSGTVSTDSGSTAMTLTGLVGSFDRFPSIRANGELFFGSGNTIVKIDDTGVFVPAAFTLPTGWTCVSFALLGDNMAILAKSVESGENTSKVFFWDLTATTGVVDEVTIPMGGPQVIINHTELLRVVCAKNGIVRIYQLLGKVPTKTHQLNNSATETDTQAIVPDTTKFIKDNVFYFGMWKTDKSGIYGLGQTDDTKPLALVLSKRFGTTDYSLHKPLAAYPTGANLYASYDDNGTKTLIKIEGSSPSRSSSAVYESIWIDLGSPETLKEWVGFYLVGKPIPASCTITIDARVDNASSYDSSSSMALTNANDQTNSGGTADTFWFREWTSLVGRSIQFRIRVTSSGTSKPSIYMISLLSREITPL